MENHGRTEATRAAGRGELTQRSNPREGVGVCGAWPRGGPLGRWQGGRRSGANPHERGGPSIQRGQSDPFEGKPEGVGAALEVQPHGGATVCKGRAKRDRLIQIKSGKTHSKDKQNPKNPGTYFGNTRPSSRFHGVMYVG